MKSHPELQTRPPRQYSLPAPYRPLPPLPGDLIPFEEHIDEQQVRPPRIIDRGREKKMYRIQRTLDVPSSTAVSTRKRDDSYHYPLPLFSPRTPLQNEAGGEEYIDSQRIHKVIQTICKNKLTTGSPDSREDSMSTVATPSERYETRPKLSLATKIPLYDSKYRLTPIEIDLGVLEVISSISDSNTPTKRAFTHRKPCKKIHHSLGNEQMMKRIPSVTTFELPSGSVVAVIQPQPKQSTRQRSIYLPGKISIAINSPSNFHLTPLDLLQDATESVEIQLRDKVEDVMADEIVEFFGSFGSGFGLDSLNTGLDAFWKVSPLLQNIFCRSKSDARRSSPSKLPAKLQIPSWYQNLPGEFFSTEDKSFGFLDQNYDEWEGKRKSWVSLSQQFGSHMPPQYPPGMPTSPLPVLPPTPPTNSQRKSKSSIPSPQRISLRRLLYSAGRIV
jgi:hypothetical protein